MKTLLKDSRIHLRPPEPTDLPSFAKWENDTSIWDTGSTVAPYSMALIEDYIANYNPDIFTTKQLRFIVELNESGKTVGAVDIFNFDPVNRRAFVGYLIDAEFRGNSYGADALKLIAEYSRCRLNMIQICAIVGVDNYASIATLQHAGFFKSGELKSWIVTDDNNATDALVYQLIFA